MRTATFSSLAVLASSLLVKDVFARPHAGNHAALHKRDVVVDNVVVTEEIIVTKEADGSYETGLPKAVGTTTIPGTVVVTSAKPISTIVPTTSSKPIVEAAPAPEITSSSSSVIPSKAVGAVFQQAEASSSTSTTPAPTTTSTPVETPKPIPTPTTFATVASSSAAPVATSSAASVSSSSGKRGVAYNDASLVSAFTGDSAVTWAYNWGSSTSKIPSSIEYCPMLWGMDASFTDNWNANADKAIAAGSTHLLGFNEPDYSGQANLGTAAAAAGWRQYMEPYAGKARLGSPAVTNGGAPMGLTWLQTFVKTDCAGCTIDFVNIHWYNGGDANAFKAYVTQANTDTNKPVWITEFQASGSSDEQAAFLEEVIPWLDSQSFVERYAYFMASDGNLISGTTLSTLGRAYASTA